MNFLDQLPISAAEKAKLLQLAAPSPAALLGLIEASPAIFAHYFGPRRTEELVDWLAATLSENDRASFTQPVPSYPIQESTFAIGPAPSLPPTTYNIADRDRLFDHLQQLRSESSPSDRTRNEIAACEAKLNALLE